MSVGRIIADKYCLLSELGRGAMGSVWAAEHLMLRSQVAIKLIEPQALQQPNVQDRFEREARALAKLRSRHVVPILDYGVDSGTQYLVMELLHGETLRARLAEFRRLEPSEVSTVVQHVARAMTWTHGEGFIHRDLKPENIFLTRDGDELVVKVLDFGISKLASEASPLTQAGGMLGTCNYMSPEQARGLAADFRTDLWSLGVIAFECLTGFLPFRGNSAVAIFSAICAGPIVVPSEVARVPVGFDAWFARTVCRDAVARFESAAQLSAALQPILDGQCEWVGSDSPERWSVQEDDDDTTQRITVVTGSARERRSDHRVPSSIPVAIDGRRDLQSTGLVYNASRSGALLATQRAWEPNQPIQLTLHLDSAMQGESVDAKVVRVTRHAHAFWKFEVGVEFIEPLPEVLFRRVEAKAKTKQPF